MEMLLPVPSRDGSRYTDWWLEGSFFHSINRRCVDPLTALILQNNGYWNETHGLKEVYGFLMAHLLDIQR